MDSGTSFLSTAGVHHGHGHDPHSSGEYGHFANSDGNNLFSQADFDANLFMVPMTPAVTEESRSQERAPSSHSSMSTSPPLPPSPPTSTELNPDSAETEIFTCRVCRKDFAKRTSRDRHTRRCRNKRPEDTIPRKKSCNHCATSKARCDQKRPQCTRCRGKGLSCRYAYQPSPEVTETTRQAPPVSQPMELNFNDPSLLADVDLNIGAGGDIFAGWSESTALTNRCNMTFLPDKPTDVPYLDLSMRGGAPPFSPLPDSPDSDAHCASQCRELSRTRPIAPERPIRRQEVPLPVNAYPQADLVSRLLQSFITTFKKNNAPLPFIHKSRLMVNKRSECIANVNAIVHMMAVKSPDNKAFVSDLLKGEWERLVWALSTPPSPAANEWDNIERYQAMTILALLRLFEGDMTMKDLNTFENCASFVGLEKLFMDRSTGEETWDSWLIMESRRRLFTTVFLFDRVFHYRHKLVPVVCNTLGKVQLPGHRRVWEATTEEEWRAESEFVKNWPGYGDTREWVTLTDLWEGSSRMGVWYAGIDSLGAALMADAVVPTGDAMRMLEAPRGKLLIEPCGQESE